MHAEIVYTHGQWLFGRAQRSQVRARARVLKLANENVCAGYIFLNFFSIYYTYSLVKKKMGVG